MEKFNRFRDRGSGVSPFLPVTTPSNTLAAIPRTVLFLLRLVPFVAYVAIYFLVLQYIPFPTAVRKLMLWLIMGLPGIWWVDLQIDGVKRGHLSQQPVSRVPQPGSVIAASFTSPIDPLYLAAIFDPIFTISFPATRKVRHVSLLGAIIHALGFEQLQLLPLKAGSLTDIRSLLARYPDRIIAVFPECGTTNGRGTLPLSPSLLAVYPTTKIFPVSMRYTPPDITTPIPGEWVGFLWKLLSRPTHCIRVRIAESLTNNSVTISTPSSPPLGVSGSDNPTFDEQQFLDRVADSLSRLGRNKRVGLTLEDKASFMALWKKPRDARKSRM